MDLTGSDEIFDPFESVRVFPAPASNGLLFTEGIKRAAHIPDCDHLDELLEMQRSGLRVVLPQVKARSITTQLEQPRDAIIVDPCQQLRSIRSGVLQDWIDLSDLGGTPPWPLGLSYADVCAELHRRSLQIRQLA